jgi:Amidohydrolase family
MQIRFYNNLLAKRIFKGATPDRPLGLGNDEK